MNNNGLLSCVEPLQEWELIQKEMRHAAFTTNIVE